MSVATVKKVKTSEIELKDRLVAVNRVTKVTKGGRAFSFAAIIVVGDEKGVVGHGLGKAKEVTDAVQKGIDDAKKSLVKVPIINGTVPHEAYGKFGG
ncbi:MAG: ribosomal protein, partial [Bacteroidota bacterium]